MRQCFVLLIACLAATSGWAGEPKAVSWGDLGQSLRGLDNPYFGLTANETHLLGVLVDISETRAAGEFLSARDLEGEQIALAALESVGIDGEAKVLSVLEFGDRLAESQVALNKALIGREIEIPGFALPLEFDGFKVTEFLLVPYAGACVHTPPPPSNQIIHVSSPEGFEMRGLFDPVVVQGNLTSSGEDMDVGLSDGNAEFPVGYRIESGDVEIYR